MPMTHRTTSNFHCSQCGMLIAFKDSHDTRKKRIQERLHAKICKVKASSRQVAENDIEYAKFIAKQVSHQMKNISNGYCKTESKGQSTTMNSKADTSVAKTFQTVVPGGQYESAVNHLYKSDDKFIKFVVDIINEDTNDEKLLIQNSTNSNTLESTYVFNWNSKQYGEGARFQMPCALIHYLFKSKSEMTIEGKLDACRVAIIESIHRQNS